MKRAIQKLEKKPSITLIDGNKLPVMKNYKLKKIDHINCLIHNK